MVIPLMFSPSLLADKKCLYVSSYHQGYAWSDALEQGMRSVLTGHCEIRQIDMDSKRQKEPAQIKQAVAAVISQIKNWQPDVVITSDDNAAKYLIQPHYKDASIPFVFSGVNWTVEEYGFPYSNVTGIIEVAPLDAMLSNASRYSGGRTQAVYIGADTLTEKKNLKRVAEASQKAGIQLTGKLVSTTQEWQQAYLEAQNSGFIVLGSFSGIQHWDENRLSAFAIKNAKNLVVTSHDWMMPYSTIGFTKIPQEQGEWAAQAALEILKGRSPSEIPIVSNRKWELWINHQHLHATGIVIPRKLLRKAKKVTL